MCEAISNNCDSGQRLDREIQDHYGEQESVGPNRVQCPNVEKPTEKSRSQKQWYNRNNGLTEISIFSIRRPFSMFIDRDARSLLYTLLGLTYVLALRSIGHHP